MAPKAKSGTRAGAADLSELALERIRAVVSGLPAEPLPAGLGAAMADLVYVPMCRGGLSAEEVISAALAHHDLDPLHLRRIARDQAYASSSSLLRTLLEHPACDYSVVEAVLEWCFWSQRGWNIYAAPGAATRPWMAVFRERGGFADACEAVVSWWPTTDDVSPRLAMTMARRLIATPGLTSAFRCLAGDNDLAARFDDDDPFDRHRRIRAVPIDLVELAELALEA